MFNSSINRTLCWQITNKCNRNCSFCISKSSSFFKIQDYKEQIQIIDKIIEIGTKKISISGGEPFLVKHLKQIVEYVLASNSNLQITTNSDFFINKGIPQWVFDYNIPIILSLYGGELEHNNVMGDHHFNTVLKIAKKFNREQISINIIETEESIKFIENNITLLKKTFLRVLLLKKINENEIIKKDNFSILKKLFSESEVKLEFQFLYHDYDTNNVFPVINDIGDITFTSNKKTENIGSIFSSEIVYDKIQYNVSDFFSMIWQKQYTNDKMKIENYEQYN